jgi:flagellar motor switch protein FliN
MSDKSNYLDCWIRVATSLFSQALLGEPVLADALPKPMPPGSFGFAATLEGDEEGRFAVVLDGSLAEAALFGEGEDQKAGWAELLKEAADAATGELLAKMGRKCQVSAMIPIEAESKLSRAFRLQAGEQGWLVQVNSEVRLAKAAKTGADTKAETAPAAKPAGQAAAPCASQTAPLPGSARPASAAAAAGNFSPASSPPGLSPGLSLLLDVELEVSLRFGAREMPLGEILDLGPGDVVQLDRHIHDPVDLIVGDKIVASGEVVLVNGNFGLRVTHVAEPQKRLESIRCLF